MTQIVGLDVYGTLVDPLGMEAALVPSAGSRAGEAAALWRTKQIEYAFRRVAMAAYADFTVCTRQALHYTASALGFAVDAETERALLETYLRLPAFPDVAARLAALCDADFRLFAFSNGTEAAVRTVLGHAGLLDLLDGIVSVDDACTFKPVPAVYRLLVERGGQPADHTWLVSSNGWDVIGAKHAGLRAIWLRRDPAAVLDPWDIAPDATVASLDEVPAVIASR